MIRHKLNMIVLIIAGLWTLIAAESFINFNTSEIIRHYGYIAEEHELVSDDGYILHLVHMHSKSGPTKGPVYMQPGLISSSVVFVCAGPKRSAAFVFADQGYDIWISDVRGTTFSRKHIKYTSDQWEYWNFTFEELGTHDSPALINYILEKTGATKVHYFCHSMGGTQLLAAMSLMPDYFQKTLRSVTMLGPVARFDQTRSLLIQAMNYTKIIDIAMKLGAYETFGYIKVLASGVSTLLETIPSLFTSVLSLVSDETPEYIDLQGIEVFFSHYPAGCSAKTFNHLIQLTERPGFNRYIEPGQTEIRPYPLCNIPNIPIFIICGIGDLFSNPRESAWLQKNLLQCQKSVLMKMYKGYGHAAFLAPIDEYPEFLRDTLKLMATSEQNLILSNQYVRV